MSASPALAVAIAGVFGLLVGSFLNVVILRLPARMEWQWRRECAEHLAEFAARHKPTPPLATADEVAVVAAHEAPTHAEAAAKAPDGGDPPRPRGPEGSVVAQSQPELFQAAENPHAAAESLAPSPDLGIHLAEEAEAGGSELSEPVHATPVAEEAPADREPPGIVMEPSHCPVCGMRLKPWHNIPVLSWLALRGRCAGCGTPISLQYPAVELLTGLAFAAVVLQFGLGWQTLAVLIFTGLLIAMAGIDARTTLLPDSLTLPLLWLGLLASTQGLFVPMDQAILGAAVGYLALWSVFWAFKLLTGKEGMGYGDFKLLAALGAWCGLQGLLPIVLMSASLGALVGSLWLAARGRDHATPIPFGPFLALAGWVYLLWGDAIQSLYLGLVQLD